jgi:Sulfotransferase domain
MPRIRRRLGDRAAQNQHQHGAAGAYSFAQFLVILLGIFVIVVNLKAVLEHERGELRLRAATVQNKDNSLLDQQTLIDQIVENAAQQVASKATSHIEKHLSAFALSNIQAQSGNNVVENSKIPETNAKDAAFSERTNQEADAQSNDAQGPDSKHGIGEFNEWPARKPKIPNVLVAGVQRGATTSLTKYLVDQFDACSYRSDRLFFAQEKLSATSYASMYSNCTGNKILVDGSPDTIMYPAEVKKLYEEDGSIDDLKIIVTLREPVERELSSYNNRRWQLEAKLGGADLIKRGGAVRDFTEDVRDRLLKDFKNQNVKALYGTYADQLAQWFQMFNRKQILILSFTELQRNQTAYLDRVHAFLSQQPRRPEQVFPVEAKAQYQQEKTEHLCKYMNFVWNRFFRAHDKKLQPLLTDNPGPVMEQTPFPPFQVQCISG